MGKIAKIQLRGISRAPSDRMTSDGGCAESLNVYLDSGETAPVLIPEDKTDIVGSNGKEYKAKRVFIHKTANYTNYILHLEQGNQIGVYMSGVNGDFKAFVTLDTEETLCDITSIGNTVILATSKRMMYALFANGEYRYLGDRIPEPYIEFRCVPSETNIRTSSITLLNGGDNTANAVNLLNVSVWQTAIERLANGSTEDADGYVARLIEIENQIWSEVKRRIRDRKGQKAFICPVFVRYAVRLYDGSYIYQSVPILLGAGYDKFLEVTADKYAGETITTSVSISTTKPYEVTAHMLKWDTEGWSDIVSSVDLFISTDVCNPNLNAHVASLSQESETVAGNTTHTKFSITFANGDVSDEQAMEAELLSKSLFFKIASFACGEESELSSGFNLFKGDYKSSQDDLVENDRLPDYEQSGTTILSSRITSYNNRILAVGSKRILPTGYNFLQSTNIIKTEQRLASYAFAFYVNTPAGQQKIVSRSYDGKYLIPPYSARIIGEQGATTSYAIPYGFLCFPDRRCEKVKIFEGEDVYTFEMKSHPLLNCSYAYWGLSKTIAETRAEGDVSLDNFVSDENRYEENSNRIYLSEIGNPFYFPISGNTLLHAPITDIAIANTSLSEGQFGQFPVYAFTREGIWVLETGADGSFVSSKPLSRETPLPGAAIASLDQAVVFISAKGVMLLSGSQITDISPYMNGRHYVLEGASKNAIASMPFYQDLLPAITDPDPFMKFMADAKIAYDYSGKRLIFISPSNMGYQYVYKLDTQTWHKISLGLNLSDTINSYPDCLIMADNVDVTKIYDLSTKLDVASVNQKTPKAVIITRPFDMDEPDVHKSIRMVRIRGQYNKGNVQFFLLGSDDGLNFYTLKTLRGKSWKVFRIVILAHLAPTERLSWIDVEYESRLTNRLR
jgi:hypothetical protein